MRNALKLLAPISLLALVACSASEDQYASEEAADATAGPAVAMSEESSADAGPSAIDGRPQIQLSLPKMAYVFDYGFRLTADAIAPLQRKHADMCEALGPGQCQIVSLIRTGEEDDVTGQLQLAVASDRARGFAELLSAAAERDGAEGFRADIEGEDMAKSLVDTEARVRSNIALRDRLMDVLETRKGKVEELVEAERSVAAVNEEIDQAQSWLRETRGRVAYSRMNLTYETANPGGSFLDPIEGAFAMIGSILGVTVAAIIVMLAIAGPFVLGALGINRWLRRGKAAEA
jgi:hypothetical protein